MTSIVFIPILFLMIAIIIAIPVLLGIYVYKDAKSRDMDAVLWTLVTFITPGLLGLIIYLIVRRDHIVLNCPKCGNEVSEDFITCPACGQKLKSSCSNCGTALNPEWKICPQCGNEITETVEFTPPTVKGKDSKGLKWILLALLIIPIIIITIFVIGIASYTVLSDSTASVDPNSCIEDFTEYVSPTVFEVMNVKDVELDEKYSTWINEKKSDKDGIYCMTYEEDESASSETDSKSYQDYILTYKYMILVVNPTDGQAYNLVNSNYTTADNSILVKNPSVMLNEVDAANGDEFGNVFVIKFLSSYDLHINFNDGKTASIADEYQDFPLTVNTSTANGNFDYSLPANKKESYIEFAQAVKDGQN